MIALCLAALLGTLAGPLLAVAFASPLLVLTAPLFASLAALSAGCVMALVSTRAELRAERLALATASDRFPEAADTGSSPERPESDAGIGASHRHERYRLESDQLADQMVAALRHILSQADLEPGKNNGSDEGVRQDHEIDHPRKTG